VRADGGRARSIHSDADGSNVGGQHGRVGLCGRRAPVDLRVDFDERARGRVDRRVVQRERRAAL
jgi:hypothetical protein